MRLDLSLGLIPLVTVRHTNKFEIKMKKNLHNVLGQAHELRTQCVLRSGVLACQLHHERGGKRGRQGGDQVCLCGGLLVNDLRCCLGGRQGGLQVCLFVVFVVVFVVVTRPTC